jgi:hypothetical protein
MNFKSILSVTVGICLTALVYSAEGRELKDFAVEITTLKRGAEAKQEAFDQAVEQATREMAEEIMGGEKTAKSWDSVRDKVLKNSTKYVVFIKGSPPLEVKGQSKVQVQMRLSPDHLEAALREAGLYGGETVRLLPLVQVMDPSGSRFIWWADVSDGKTVTQAQAYFKKLFQQLNSQFKGKNVNVLDPTNASFRNGIPASYRSENLRKEDQVLFGQYLNADVVLSGRVQVTRPRADSLEHKIEYTMELWQTKTGRNLAEVSTVETVGSDNPKAIQAVMDEVQPKMLAGLATKLQSAMGSGHLNLSIVRISVEGGLTPKQMSDFKKLLESVREIRMLRERLLEASRTTFEGESSVNGTELVKALQKTRFPNYSVSVSQASDDRLVLSVRASAQ